MAARRLGGIYRLPGGELAKIAEAVEGDLVALGRSDGVATGATVSPGASPEQLPFPAAPEPVYSLAIATSDHKDDAKLSGALQKQREADPTLSMEQQQDTSETVLYGQGEMHLNSTVERLARDYGLRVTTHRPQVAFKETIRRAVHEHGRLKKQSGGHGQFADVKIDISPRPRGEGFQFIDKIVGGAVPRNFIPAVAEAAEESAKKGPFGFPVVDISVTLVDGGFHSVDSSDMAFKTATSLAMKEGLAKADPILLEPVDHVTISVPSEFTPRAQRLLTGRRGQILGFSEKEGWSGWDDVVALVPEAELHDLIIDLRSQTLGLGHVSPQVRSPRRIACRNEARSGMMNLFDLTGKVALVTGGNGGIGLAMAQGMASCGASIAIAGRNEGRSGPALASLRELGARCMFITGDVTKKAACTKSGRRYGRGIRSARHPGEQRRNRDP